MDADGFSLDDKREPIKFNDIPNIIEQYRQYKNGDGDFSDKKAKAFVVEKQDIANNKYDLSINRYKEIEYEHVAYDAPLVILDKLDALELDIQKDLKALREML